MGYTPFHLNYVYCPESILDLVMRHSNDRNQSATEQTKHLKDDFTEAKKNLKEGQERNQRYFNRHHKQQKFRIGDQVMLSTGKEETSYLIGLGIHPNSKFINRFVGSFQVKERIGKNTDLFKLSNNWKQYLVLHVSRLKTWEEGQKFRNNVLRVKPRTFQT